MNRLKHSVVVVNCKAVNNVVALTRQRGTAIADEVARLDRTQRSATLRRPEVRYPGLVEKDPERPDLPLDLQDEVETEVKYAGYIAQAETSLERSTSTYDGWVIPPQFDYRDVRGLSNEAVERLSKARPSTVAHTRRVAGITPEATTLVLVHLRRLRGRS